MRDEQKSETANRERFYEDLAKRFVNDKFLDLHALTYNAVHWAARCTPATEQVRPLDQDGGELPLAAVVPNQWRGENNRVIGNTMPIVRDLAYRRPPPTPAHAFLPRQRQVPQAVGHHRLPQRLA